MKELKLLLDMYKGLGKEQRDKAQLMAAERKMRSEVEDLRQQLKKIQVIIIFLSTKNKISGEVKNNSTDNMYYILTSHFAHVSIP